VCQHGTACVHEAEQTTTVQTKLLRTYLDNDRLCQTVDICAVGHFCFTGTAKTID